MKLSSELDFLLRQVVTRRISQPAEVLDRIRLGLLSEEDKQELISALTQELLCTGLAGDDEPNGRGLLIEDLIDRINAVNRS